MNAAAASNKLRAVPFLRLESTSQILLPRSRSIVILLRYCVCVQILYMSDLFGFLSFFLQRFGGLMQPSGVTCSGTVCTDVQ